MRSLLTVTWFGLAVWFLLSGSGREDGSHPEPAVISAESLDRGPLRTMLGDPPMVEIGGVDQRCSDCHAIFASLDETPHQIRQHTDIVLDHGLNDRCYNCHAQAERNRLVLHDGSLVGFTDSSTLCGQCHGTLLRDWERGMHGKTLGSWDASSPDHRRVQCVECHDPHAPAFAPMVPLPGPTRRPSDVHHASDSPSAAELRNPLERWKHARNGNERRKAIEEKQ